MNEAEWQTRKKRIDTRLRSANPPWTIIRYRDGLDLSSLACHAVEELLEDYRDFLRVRGATLWDKDSREALFVRKLGANHDVSYETYKPDDHPNWEFGYVDISSVDNSRALREQPGEKGRAWKRPVVYDGVPYENHRADVRPGGYGNNADRRRAARRPLMA